MMRAVVFNQAGGPEVLAVGSVPKPFAQEREVLIQVSYTALNRADTLQRKGSYPVPEGASEILGLECSGTIVELGEGCHSDLSVGDRVMALLPGGGYAEFVNVSEETVLKVPDSIALKDAAGVCETFLTAFQILHKIAGIKKGDNVLIHAGGSGVGTSAIQLCNLFEANAIVTGSESKLDRCLSLGAKTAIDRNLNGGKWADAVMKATNGKGVDIIMDPIGGSYFQQNLDVIGVDGRWVVFGLMGGATVNQFSIAKILRKRVRFEGTLLRARSLGYKGELVKSFIQHVYNSLESGKIRPLIDSVFPMEEASKAHRFMEENKNIGKILLQIAQDK
eukprot:176749_1